MDGVCHESPRWVSLLVAEIFYPHTRFPTASSTSKIPLNKLPPNPPSPPTQSYNAGKFHQYNHLSIPNHLNQMGSADDFQNLQQYLHRRGGYRTEATPIDDDLVKPRRMRKQIESRVQILTEKEKDADNNRHVDSKTECDGHDSIGCYVVRVYYDWFLVPGSCKCWKKSSSSGSSLDTLKKIFVGK